MVGATSNQKQLSVTQDIDGLLAPTNHFKEQYL